MAVKTVRKGLNRETRALLEYIRRMAPVNRANGLSHGNETDSYHRLLLGLR
jgi:hypothetical protein